MSYEQWRSTVPWTDEQIAAALEQEADSVEVANAWLARRYRHHASRVMVGRLSLASLRVAIGRLVTACGICGKKALYITGSEGRCSAHRLIKSHAAAERSARVEARATDGEATKRGDDGRALDGLAAASTRKFNRSHRK
jgi:hypothetical protein